MTLLIISTFLLYFLLFSPVFTSSAFRDFPPLNETSMPGNKLKTMKLIKAHLKKINRPFVKSIKTPDGDIIDCVLFNRQLSFDLPEIKEKMSWKDPPKLPKGRHAKTKMETKMKQLWSSKGESCPNGTIPIRRTSESDLVRSMSISKHGRKVGRNDYPGSADHEYGVVATRGQFYGAKANLNLWKPNVDGDGFSLSQIWVVADTHKTQTLEAGWQVYPRRNNDNNPRLFIYWTADGYRRTGCYNLACPGFVQTNTRIALGAALYPTSAYNNNQYDFEFLIWKDPRSGDWWLEVGSELIGYWPQTLFPDLRDHATLLEYGGEVASQNLGRHTSTQMGSGHFPAEGFGRAAYVRNLEMVDKDNVLNPLASLILLAPKPNCYDVRKGYNNAWGNYIYFGGPGNNPKCP